MLRSLSRFIRSFVDPAQLALSLEGSPRTADELLALLRSIGMRRIDRCRLTRNRAVMVSFRDGELRVHEGYLAAPAPVLRAIVTFVEGKSRAERRAAQQVILTYPVLHPESSPRRGAPRTHDEDRELSEGFTEWHREYNARYFGGRLRQIPIRVSRRMRSRLGHYTAGSGSGAAEIAISRHHVIRHGADEALHTLLHEMIHQWQDETGQPIDHGRAFRSKARELGITAAARRSVTARRTRRLSRDDTLRLTAARGD